MLYLEYLVFYLQCPTIVLHTFDTIVLHTFDTAVLHTFDTEIKFLLLSLLLLLLLLTTNRFILKQFDYESEISMPDS